MKLFLTFLLNVLVFKNAACKYLEGELNTHENWAFMARFCFLSEYGEFEYLIEFDEEQGNPNLLLYYDTDDQWPAVYKTNKTCFERESVLHVEQNQIINLTTTFPHQDLAGCINKRSLSVSTPAPRYTISVPTSYKRRKTTKTPAPTKSVSENATTPVSTTFSNAIKGSDYTTAEYSTTTDSTTTVLTSTVKSNIAVNLTDVENDNDFENFFESLTTIVTPTKYSEDTTESRTTEITKSPIKKRSVVNNPKQYKKGTVVICQNARRFQSSRERWWFLAVSNCNGTTGIKIKYKILMTNGQPGDYWHEHFSADQFYILPVLMSFAIAYSLLFLGIILCTIELKSRQLLHSTYKLFVLSVFVQYLGVILQCAAYLKYAVNGIGAPMSKTFGSMFMGCSETCFLLLLLLLAKGYTVTRGRLPISASVKLTIFMCLYCITYICIFIYEAKVFDPGEVLYLYESPAGYGLIALRIIAWLMFIYSTIFTLKRYPEKSNFYYPFNICGTMWFIAGPAFIISANTYIDKWVRESVVVAVLLFITFGGHLMFLILTLPSMANKNFPFHVRTTQIGIMEVTGNIGANTIENFSHHPYEPNQNLNEQQTVIIPLTRRTEEIFGTLYTHHLQSNFARRPNNNDSTGEVNHAQQIAMQNVLSWSSAKNISTLDIPRLERLEDSYVGSPYSKQEDRSSAIDDRSRRSSSATMENGDAHRPTVEEYIKDVPIELFTVSKMVIQKKNDVT